MPNMAGSDFLSAAFKQSGVTHIFTVPTHLFATLVKLEGSGIRRVMAHGEKAAAYMADGYAQASFKPAIVISQGGPGGTNLAAGLAEPWMSRTPVIALTRAQHANTTQRHQYQEVYAEWRNVTKYDAHVEALSYLPHALRQAFREATTGAPGPVHVESQEAVELSEADLVDPFIEDRFTRYPAFRPEPEPDAIHAAAQRLASAEQPVIVVGGGAMASQAWNEVVELAELLQIPVGTSLSAKGVIPERHPLAIGVVGTYGIEGPRRVVGRSDLVLFVGIHAGSQSTNNWTAPAPGHPVIQIDIDPAQLGKNYPNAVSIVGDARVCLRRLIDALKEQADRPAKHQWADEARAIVAEAWAPYREALDSDEAPVRPERLCRELSDCLPPDAAVVSDTGYAAAWTGAFLRLGGPPGRNYFRCQGSLGWSFPASIGVKCARPHQPVVCVTGDGGFYYHMAELETAVRYGLNTVTVVLNNHSLIYDWHILQELFGGRGAELSEFSQVDFAAVARSFGAVGIRAASPTEIAPAVAAALACGKPAVVDVLVARDPRAPVSGNTPLLEKFAARRK